MGRRRSQSQQTVPRWKKHNPDGRFFSRDKERAQRVADGPIRTPMEPAMLHPDCKYTYEQFQADMAKAKATLKGRHLDEALGEIRRRRSASVEGGK